jgi:hypothetical protein
MINKSLQYENIKYIFSNIIPLLLIAQFDLLLTKNYAISTIIIVIIAFIFILKNYFTKSIFLVIILIYISSYFNIFPTIGHSFSLMFLMAFLSRKINKKPIREASFKDNSINIALFILSLFTILGWAFKSQLENRYLFTSIISFFSLLFLYHTTSGIIWSRERVLLFLKVTAIIIIYALFTAIMNPFNIMPFKSSLWNSYYADYKGVGTIFVSMIERPSTAIGAMIFGFFFSWTLNTNKLSLTKSQRRLIIVTLTSAFLICIIGFSKSHTLVLFSSILIIVILNSLIFKANIIKGNLKVIPYFILFFSIIIITNSFFNYKYLILRFEQQSGIVDNFIENPLLPKNTSREESFTMAQNSLKRENWLIGYGYANGGQNRRAWLGKDHKSIRKKDFHNTYYSLPQLFGWVGAVSYILIFIITIFRLFIVAKNKNNDNIFRVFSLSLFVYFILHLLTEYTITALSSPHYMMMIFIMLGLSNALYYNNKYGLLKKTKI